MRAVNRLRFAHRLAADGGPAGGGMTIDRRLQGLAVVAGVVGFGDCKATQRGRKPIECVALKGGAE